MIDVDHQISAVSRTVGDRVLDAGAARVVTISQTYAYELDELWDAVTDAERIPRWFAPVSGDLSLGGRYQIEGNAGGTVERCDPPKGFALTWEFGGEVSWVTVTLTPVADGTRFELEHVAHVDDERWAEYGPGAVGVGWDLAVLGLAQHLSDPTADVPQEARTSWTESGEAARFMTRASEAWRDANVAGGADPDAAAAAGARTTAFYTGAAEPEQS